MKEDTVKKALALLSDKKHYKCVLREISCWDIVVLAEDEVTATEEALERFSNLSRAKRDKLIDLSGCSSTECLESWETDEPIT